MLKSIWFIINPISSGKDKSNVIGYIDTFLDKNKFNFSIHYTEYAGHGILIAQKAIKENIDIVCAVGGDGTINEIGSSLVHSSVALAMIPFGSGNGFARHLNIPLDSIKAIKLLNNSKEYLIDTWSCNDKYFANVAGVGFDAHISSVFSRLQGRGFKNYIKASLLEFANYNSAEYELRYLNKNETVKAFMISLANSTQYGNNAVISPDSKMDDGLLEICIVPPLRFWHIPIFVFGLFTRKQLLVKIIKLSELVIKRTFSGDVHLDGEPLEMGKTLEIKGYAKSLKVIVSK